MAWKDLLNALGDLLFVRKCRLDLVDGACIAEADRLCYNCKEILLTDGTLKSRRLDGSLVVHFCAPYYGEPRKLIHRLKWRERHLAPYVARMMTDALLNASEFEDDSFDCIVPVPSLKNNERWSSSQLLAQNISTQLNIPLATDLLNKEFETRSFSKSRAERMLNVKSAYTLSESSAGLSSYLIDSRRLLLVDDIVASGATLIKCGQLLRSLNSQLHVIAIAYASSEWVVL